MEARPTDRTEGGPRGAPGAAAPAVFVGAVGGSGTRLVVQIAAAGGVFVGCDLNRSLDSVPGTEFLRRHLPLPEGGPWAQDVRADLREALARHRRGIPRAAASWLVKNPRWSHALPLLVDELPHHRFVHVVRDGRDMAFSQNQGQLRDLAGAVLGDDLADAPPPVRSAAFWARQNLAVVDVAERRLGPQRYLRIRFEDLCAAPRETCARLLAFLDAPRIDADAAAALVRPPSSIGRWRAQEPALARSVAAAARPALAQMGYSAD